MESNKELITAQELADVLDLSVETIWRYSRQGKIPHVQLGQRQYRYRLDDVIKALDSSTAREQTAEYKSESTPKLTYQDYLKLPEEPGYRYEVLEGTLVKEPTPNIAHQRASRQLQRMLEDYFWKQDPGSEVLDAPVDVTLEEITVVQPDLLYISGDQQEDTVRTNRVDGPPALVVEVISPGSVRKDRLQKLQIYQKAGVQHYWLVNPEEKTLECFELRDGAYALMTAGMDNDVVEPPAFPGLAVEMENLWKRGAPSSDS